MCFFSFTNLASAQVYVQKGDTLSKIAKDVDMPLKELIELNPHIKNPNNIRPGDYIIFRSKTEPQKDLVDYARSLAETTTYVYGGQNPPYETDCSGWVQHVYKKFGVDLPRVSRDQARTGKPVTFKQLEIGDLMFFSTRADKVITHSGIYMGDNLWISNLNTAKDVEILATWGKWTQAYFQWGARYEL
jgi:LysM repeat protein